MTDLIPIETILEEHRHDPEFRAEWGRLAPARALAIRLIGYRVDHGLTLAVIELKNMADEKATIETAFNQLQTYQAHIPRLFHCNELLVISDGGKTKIGAIGAGEEHFTAWKTIDGETVSHAATLEVAIKGIFAHRRFLDLVRSFIVFEDDGGAVVKKIARYHQFHAVRKALDTALRATAPNGDRKGGVLWHTQGSGKSLTMLFFAGKLARHPAMQNPTIVILTDRTDLDDQLFDTFAKGKDVLGQVPVQAGSRAHLRDLLRVGQGGIVFTGTPLELADRDTRVVFGDSIDVYDVDHATALQRAFAITSATKPAQAAMKEITFFATVKAAIAKTTGRDGAGRGQELDHAIRQLVDAAIAPEGVVDIFAAAGLPKPDISILSDAFLAEIRDLPQRNLALELLRKLLNDEISAQKRTSVVQAKRFSERLEESIRRYHHRALEMAEIIDALIQLAQDMNEAGKRGERLGLSTAEVAFYDALSANDSAVDILGDAQLRLIAGEVAATVRTNTTIDWTVREAARANLRRAWAA